MLEKRTALPDQMPVQDFLDLYRHARQDLLRLQDEFRVFSQIPGAERDPKVNELAGEIMGKQATLLHFSGLVTSEVENID